MRSSPSGSSKPIPYSIVVRGEMKSVLSSVLDCSSIETRDGLTVLVIDVRDSSHLSGILDRLRDLSIDIVSANVATNPGERGGR